MSAETLEWRRQKAGELRGIGQRRAVPAAEMQIREANDGSLHVVGYASVYERDYEMGWFVERVAAGAGKRTLGERPDCIFCVNHALGGSMPLARTKSGTLTLGEDAHGLKFDASLDPEDPDAASLARKMRRGDISECSMMFQVTDDFWSDDFTRRVIRSYSLARGDVSVVNFAANDAATAEVRAREAAAARAGEAVELALPDYATRAAQELELMLLRERAGIARPSRASVPARTGRLSEAEVAAAIARGDGAALSRHYRADLARLRKAG